MNGAALIALKGSEPDGAGKPSRPCSAEATARAWELQALVTLCDSGQGRIPLLPLLPYT